ncbi:MAG: ATP-binding cassette domain-containing protein [Saprospiraceae bacterium]
MEIQLQQLGKRYRFDWIFRNLSYTFKANTAYAILGANGSGKSTLMKVLAGHLTPTKGQIQFVKTNKKIDKDRVYQEVSYAAPYIELVEEFTLSEQLAFHQKFQAFQKGLGTKELLDILQLKNAQHKEIRFFSSGMKQRLKLVLACCSDTSILLLDEPTTNLDEQGMQWYLDLIERFGQNRLIIVASNVPIDYQFCSQKIDIQNFKKSGK